MANPKLYDDLLKEVEPIESTEDSVVALLLGIARRIDTADGAAGPLREYAKSLRDGTDEVTSAVLANTDAAASARK